MKEITCCSGCGACCEAPSLSSSIPGMPEGKPAGVRCLQLMGESGCALYGKADRPAVCLSYQPSESCGTTREEAMRILAELEVMTMGSPARGGATIEGEGTVRGRCDNE